MYSSFLIIDCRYSYNCDMAGTVTFVFLSFPLDRNDYNLLFGCFKLIKLKYWAYLL